MATQTVVKKKVMKKVAGKPGTVQKKKKPAKAAKPALQKSSLEVELIEVAIDDIETNDYNPNMMDEEDLALLAQHIEQDAAKVQPVLLRKNPNPDGPPYMLIDGENRYHASKRAGLKRIIAVVVPYDDDKAKMRTVSMNQLRGEYIPLKMANLLADLQKRYSAQEIRRMTGIRDDEMQSLTSLLEVPEIDFSDANTVSTSSIQKSIPVTLLLLHTEHGEYHKAMVDAMEMAGPMVVPLVDQQVGQYDKAMTTVMGLEGVKLRNVGLATICRVFNALTEKQKKEMLKDLKAAEDG